METELFNGEYFIQIVQQGGARRATSLPLNPDEQSDDYREVAAAVNEQGPKYQYGTGCLSDGVLGLWMARVCGIDEESGRSAQGAAATCWRSTSTTSSTICSTHANPQRPTYAMGDDGGLLLCSWPRGGKPLLPFVYSDEVWTGIEYQVASHLIMLG